MFYFEVPDMFSCRSVAAISRSVKSVDHDATVVIDMVHHSVTIDSDRVPGEALERSIVDAGFTPILRTRPVAVDLLLPLEATPAAIAGSRH